jgi:hypothetical protein
VLRNSAKISAKFAFELSIKPAAFGTAGTTASGNLVVDRTDKDFIKTIGIGLECFCPESEPPIL